MAQQKLTARSRSNLLKRLFTDTSHPSAYTNAATLLKAARKTNRDVTLKQVKQWLSQQKTWVAHKAVRRKFQRSKIWSPGINFLWEADLTSMENLSRQNDGVRFLLCAIDVFSKRAFVVGIKNKAGRTVTDAMNRIFNDIKITPKKLRTDQGSEFKSKEFQNLMRAKKIHHYYAFGKMKAAVCERFNRSLKSRLAKFLTDQNTRRYISHLDQIVAGYNNSPHRTIKMSPASVNRKNENTVRRQIYGEEKQKTKLIQPRFRVGDLVYVAHDKGTFARGFRPNFKPPAYRILQLIAHFPYRYILIEPDTGKTLSRSYYEAEMIRVP